MIKVEFRASFLARMGLKMSVNYLLNLIEKFILSDYKIKVSEIHLATDIQGYDFNKLDYVRFSTKKRKNAMHDQDTSGNTYYYQGRRFTGFTFGSGDEMLRIYNKSIEITKNLDKAFVKDFVWIKNDKYDPSKEVWRIEIQYRREKLKTLSDSKNGVLDEFEAVLNSIPTLWDRALDQVVFKDLSHDHSLEAMLGYKVIDGIKRPLLTKTMDMRKLRAKIHPLWQELRGWNGYEPNVISPYNAPKTGSFEYVANSIKSFFSTTLKHVGHIDAEVVQEMFERANLETMDKKGLSLLDNAVANMMDYLANAEKQKMEHGVFVNGQQKLEAGLMSHMYEVMDQVSKITYSENDHSDRIKLFKQKIAKYQSYSKSDAIRENKMGG